MSELYSQFQNVCSQLKNMEIQLENINNQILNFGIQNNGYQIQNLGIQIITAGLQMVNVGIQIPNMNILNIKQQIQNLGIELQNIVGKIDIQISPFMGIQMNMRMNNNIQNCNNNYKLKKNVIFKTTLGDCKSIPFDYETTLHDALETYLKLTENTEYINNTNKVSFSFNARKIDFYDNTSIGKFFYLFSEPPPPILVDFL